MAAGSVMPKKLTIRFTSQRIETASGASSCDFGHRLPHDNKSDQNKLQRFTQKFIVQCSKKRGPSELSESPSTKRQKMDRFTTHQCSVLLKTLMCHPAGWVFNLPVDPVDLNIPDYFSIITKPMDLGTIKSKLLKNQYAGIDEFAADVRLTFSNAKRYNPPENNVHKMAVELDEIFKIKWRSLEEKWNCERTKYDDGKPLSREGSDISSAKQSGPKTPPLRAGIVPKRSNPSVEKVARSSSNSSVADANPAKVAESCMHKLAKQNLCKGAIGEGRHVSGSVGAKPLLTPVVPKCGHCGKNGCQCRPLSASSHAVSDISYERSSGKDYTSSSHTSKYSKNSEAKQTMSASYVSKSNPHSNGRSCGRDHSNSFHTSKMAKSMSASRASKSDPESDGAVSAVDDENVCPSSQLNTPTTDAVSSEGCEAGFDVQLSPSKALRAAIVKAGTILKAQQKSLLDQGDKSNPMKLQHDKERLECRQREEGARIEAQIRAAARRQQEIEMKQQRDRDREAARIALQKMEKTAGIEQNLEVLKELERLCGCSVSYDLHIYCGKVTGAIPHSGLGSPLEKLGLFIKDDFMDEEEDEDLNVFDGEEGEIIS